MRRAVPLKKNLVKQRFNQAVVRYVGFVQWAFFTDLLLARLRTSWVFTDWGFPSSHIQRLQSTEEILVIRLNICQCLRKTSNLADFSDFGSPLAGGVAAKPEVEIPQGAHRPFRIELFYKMCQDHLRLLGHFREISENKISLSRHNFQTGIPCFHIDFPYVWAWGVSHQSTLQPNIFGIHVVHKISVKLGLQ